MQSLEQWETKTSHNAAKTGESQAGIQQYFPTTDRRGSGCKTINLRGQEIGIHTLQTTQNISIIPTTPIMVTGTEFNLKVQQTPVMERWLSIQQENTGPLSMGEQDLRTLIQALPMRKDIEALIYRVEEAHNRELQVVHTDIQSISERLAVEETTTSALEQRVAVLE